MDILNTDGHRGGYGNILLPRGLSLPLDLRALSRGRGRTELEVGFGNGEYTVRHARANPDTFLLGMEVSPACVLRCARRSKGLDNLRLIRTDAHYMIIFWAMFGRKTAENRISCRYKAIRIIEDRKSVV